jgi:hypothetical protein
VVRQLSFHMYVVLKILNYLFMFYFTANQYRVQLQSSTTLQPVTTQGKIELILIGANNFNETFTLTKYENR